MCGFVAALGSPEQINREILSTMANRMTHRGPDDSGECVRKTKTGVVGLAHRRLSVIDLSDAATQPMENADGSAILAYNGEVYNYIELREELKSLGAVFQTASDTEVILQAYRIWGPECVNRFNGMFAFALWDERNQRLFVARDRFGEKPLFYCALARYGTAFASEMKALLVHPSTNDSINHELVSKFLHGSYPETDTATMFAQIKRFPAAHAALFAPDGTEIRRWRYWTPDYLDIDQDYDEQKSIEAFGELMTQSVRRRLRSDVAVGSSLSGGLDSSTIVGTVKQILAENAQSPDQAVFSARFEDDPTISEGPDIDRVVSAMQVKSYGVSPTPAGLAAESEKLHWHQEEPFLSASIYLQWCVARLARENGVTVLLDGQGADELLGGYAYFFRNFQLDKIERLELISAHTNSKLFRGRLQVASRQYKNSQRRFNANVALSVTGLLRALLGHPKHWFGNYEIGVPPAKRGSRLRRQMAESMQYTSLPALLRYADRNAMAFGRETRLPFLDYDLVDWCIKQPDKAFISNGWQKHILRQSAPPNVPSTIRWRAEKVGYAAPLDHWLCGDLEQWAKERIFAEELQDLEGYDKSTIQRTWDAHQAGKQDNSWALWKYISLAEWLNLRSSGAWQAA